MYGYSRHADRIVQNGKGKCVIGHAKTFQEKKRIIAIGATYLKKTNSFSCAKVNHGV